MSLHILISRKKHISLKSFVNISFYDVGKISDFGHAGSEKVGVYGVDPYSSI